MKRHVFAFAAIAAIGFSGAAYAEDSKPKPAAPTVMSDSEMDKVTAGDAGNGGRFIWSHGLTTASGASSTNADVDLPNSQTAPSGVLTGQGNLGTVPTTP